MSSALINDVVFVQVLLAQGNRTKQHSQQIADVTSALCSSIPLYIQHHNRPVLYKVIFFL